MTAKPISRRRALVLGGLGAAGVVTGAVGWRATAEQSSRLEPGESGLELAQPAVVASRDGRLEVELRAAAGVPLLGRDTRALGWNGTTPGPTLRVRPGDVLAVRLVNDLDEPTNLHTHGLRVSPEGNSDNPFLRIAPGRSFDYEFALPDDHPAGTFWYHPHAHGLVAAQVFGGLVGALLVDGDDTLGVDGDDTLGVDADRVLVVSDTTLAADGSLVTPGHRDRMMGRVGDLVLVNGQLRPSITVMTGSTERWRFVNATASRTLPLRLDGHDLVRIAVDGAYLPAAEPTERVVLAPASRVDVLVTPTRPGTSRLLAEAHDRGGEMAGMGGMGGMMGDGRTEAVTIASLVSTGSPTSTSPLPPTLPPGRGGGSTAVAAQREIRFGMGMAGGGMAFTINGRTFDPERDDVVVGAGTVEEWIVRNPTPMDHPFHLHVWPFTVVETSNGTSLSGTEQDVVNVPAGGWVRLRIPFARHSGRSVFHCHILDHEDAGMMATVVVR